MITPTKNAKRFISVFITITMLFFMCGLVLHVPQNVFASGAALTHQYDFNGNLEDALNTGVSLIMHPNTATSGFDDGEWWWTATSRPGGGLILETDLLTNPRSYSLGFRIRFNQVGPGWRKILSFKGPTVDNGLYFYSGNLQFYPFGSNTEITYNTNTFYDFIFTRNEDDVIRVFVVQNDGSVTKVYERDDPSAATVPIQVNGKYQFMFFMDDTATTSEWTNGGAVRSIRLWNGVINENDIGSALSDVVTEEASDISATSAVLHGSVNPYGVSTNVYFEYGLTTDYGMTAEADQNPVTSLIDVSTTITGLTPMTTYHYRVKAENDNQTIYGDNQTFTTSTIPVTSVHLDLQTLELTVGGDAATLVATIEPEDAINKNLSWNSSDESVATVTANSPVTVTPISPGTATITVTTEDGEHTAECLVTVNPAVIPLGWSITKTVDYNALALNRGESTIITYTIVTENDGSQDLALVVDPDISLDGVTVWWGEAVNNTLTLGGFEFTRVPGFDGPMSPSQLDGGTYTFDVLIKNVSADYSRTFILENEAILAIGEDGLTDSVEVTITTPPAPAVNDQVDEDNEDDLGELPRTGSGIPPGLGLLVIALGIFFNVAERADCIKSCLYPLEK